MTQLTELNKSMIEGAAPSVLKRIKKSKVRYEPCKIQSRSKVSGVGVEVIVESDHAPVINAGANICEDACSQTRRSSTGALTLREDHFHNNSSKETSSSKQQGFSLCKGSSYDLTHEVNNAGDFWMWLDAQQIFAPFPPHLDSIKLLGLHG